MSQNHPGCFRESAAKTNQIRNHFYTLCYVTVHLSLIIFGRPLTWIIQCLFYYLFTASITIYFSVFTHKRRDRFYSCRVSERERMFSVRHQRSIYPPQRNGVAVSHFRTAGPPLQERLCYSKVIKMNEWHDFFKSSTTYFYL